MGRKPEKPFQSFTGNHDSLYHPISIFGSLLRPKFLEVEVGMQVNLEW